MWCADAPQGNESAKVRWDIVQFTRGSGLDLGCGPEKAFPHFVGIDNLKDVELFGIEMRPDVVLESCERLDTYADASQDFVFSSHLLEHIEDYAAALAEWWRVIRPGGYLVLYLPHKDLYPNIGQPGANVDHKHDFEQNDITQVMRSLGGWSLVVNELRADGDEYSFLQVYRKRADANQLSTYLAGTRPKKTACVVRYGGFGDMLQAACVFPELKRQGYHVTVMTTPRGKSVIENDPHVDAWFIQDDNQIPNQWLLDFWSHHATRFDRFINLSESVEGTLLAIPGRANHFWPQEVRHKRLNVNYQEFTAEIAGVPFIPEGKFYPTDEELYRVTAMLEAKASPIVVFALSGSSQHKFYPWQDVVIARLLTEYPDVRVYMTGDEACQLLEIGWEAEPRVICLSGKQTIRETLTLAQLADVVIGPETGVLNSVAYNANVAKVVLLSHSSQENLTKHWVNTAALEPIDAPCYPCHRLHYGMKHCHEHKETGAALCQLSIAPDRVFEAVESAVLRMPRP